ncbi:MAG: winged helix-turn-helix transcriptional regulator [Candidatus Hodarchaeales archaeon]|jgi:DNA-binding Lrp family transcriptional regulator
MPLIDLDSSDLTILNKLNENGRVTYSDLAKKLMLTVPTVKSRIDKLLKIGVINHFGIHLNPHKLTGDPSAMFYFQVTKEDVQPFIEHLQSLEEIKSVYEVLDPYNIVVMTQFQPINMIQILYQELQAKSFSKNSRIQIMMKEVFSKPHRIPQHGTILNLKCEYCGKKILEDYESIKIEDTRHYFCCPICLRNYTKWLKDLGNHK